MSINLSALMKQRYDTAANWTAQNPTLLAGEIGIESDTKKWKVGTGATTWTSLVYAIGGTYPIVNADIAAAAAIVDTKLATIATAGKVSNSATTAASANTASAIVARDASGNFTAGTITAALTGAASSNVLKAGDTMTGVLAVTAGTAALPGIAVSGDTNTGIYSPGADQLAISTGGTVKATVDSSGRLLVGTSSTSGNGCLIQARNDSTGLAVEAQRSSDNASAPAMFFTKSRGTQGSPTEVSSGDQLGVIAFSGYDGAGYKDAAYIIAECDGTWTDGGDTTDNPGRLVFSTTADGAASPVPQVTITNGGLFYVGTTDGSNPSVGGKGFLKVYGRSDRSSFFAQGYSQTVSYFNRTTDDGTLLEFLQDGTTEGTISVSGTTVSYNGAHLSRWSQLPNGATREEILRGTVLSNIDEMCQWGEEENEQLNRMKVSDVEGDKNVSGVFQAWDDDDDTYTNDFYCAMTGDFIIRIAEGVTVERGDLLMSAGDGTAKPQDDDIIRSKTIAKVTSTNVSCTYEDGSYCVPCVLMAC